MTNSQNRLRAIFFILQMIGLLIKKKHYYKYMRKILTALFAIIFFAGNASFAEGEIWDYFGDQNVYGQKPVSDKEFEQALESKKKKKKRDKNIPKGEEFHQSNETQFIKQAGEELPVLCVPVSIKLSENEILPVGHYQVAGEKKNGKPYLKFYQSHYLMAEIPAVETPDDFNQETVHFVDILNNGEKQIKIIFGSIDFNAYSLVDIAE